MSSLAGVKFYSIGDCHASAPLESEPTEYRIFFDQLMDKIQARELKAVSTSLEEFVIHNGLRRCSVVAGWARYEDLATLVFSRRNSRCYVADEAWGCDRELWNHSGDWRPASAAIS